MLKRKWSYDCYNSYFDCHSWRRSKNTPVWNIEWVWWRHIHYFGILQLAYSHSRDQNLFCLGQRSSRLQHRSRIILFDFVNEARQLPVCTSIQYGVRCLDHQRKKSAFSFYWRSLGFPIGFKNQRTWILVLLTASYKRRGLRPRYHFS